MFLSILAVKKLADKKDRSYFAVKRRKMKRNLLIIIPIVSAVAVLIFGIASMSGPAMPTKMVLHNHPNLEVISNGISITVPAQIGIGRPGVGEDPLLYGDHSLDKYGMEGMSPFHTHDATGKLHVESNTVRDYTLGEFLDIWQGLEVNGKTVQATVNGNPVSDFRNIILNDGDSISLNVS